MAPVSVPHAFQAEPLEVFSDFCLPKQLTDSASRCHVSISFLHFGTASKTHVPSIAGVRLAYQVYFSKTSSCQLMGMESERKRGRRGERITP